MAMFEEQLRTWSQAMYGTLHALRLMRAVDLGNIKKVGASVGASLDWIASDLGISSAVPEWPFNPSVIKLDGEEEAEVFDHVVRAISLSMAASLTALFDECLEDVLEAKGYTPRDYPGGKLVQLRGRLPADVAADKAWALDGVAELIAIRNAIVHGAGCWSERTLGDLPATSRGTAKVGDRLAVSFGDILRYKRAVRTVLNESENKLPQAARSTGT
jgi:hypothetical protein